jgi:hypothetical protein
MESHIKALISVGISGDDALAAWQVAEEKRLVVEEKRLARDIEEKRLAREAEEKRLAAVLAITQNGSLSDELRSQALAALGIVAAGV